MGGPRREDDAHFVYARHQVKVTNFPEAFISDRGQALPMRSIVRETEVWVLVRAVEWAVAGKRSDDCKWLACYGVKA